jgi:hypothetical protein
MGMSERWVIDDVSREIYGDPNLLTGLEEAICSLLVERAPLGIAVAVVALAQQMVRIAEQELQEVGAPPTKDC